MTEEKKGTLLVSEEQIDSLTGGMQALMDQITAAQERLHAGRAAVEQLRRILNTEIDAILAQLV